MVKSCPRPAASTHHHGITPPARTTTASRRRHAPDQIRRSQPSTREDRSVVLQIGGHPMEGGGSLHDLHEYVEEDFSLPHVFSVPLSPRPMQRMNAEVKFFIWPSVNVGLHGIYLMRISHFDIKSEYCCSLYSKLFVLVKAKKKIL
ncbi:uncharacterized protein [Lolium perenne]|uniref:uncharacterized protein isoform X2 n=1 Tax=Lolium perenne TaxID=4522 RepID=UPI003A991202